MTKPTAIPRFSEGRRSQILGILLEEHGLIETPEGLWCKGRQVAKLFRVEGEAIDGHGRVLGIALSREVAGEMQIVLVPMVAVRSRQKLAACLERLGMMTPVEGHELKAIAHYVRALADLRRVLTPLSEGFHHFHDQRGTAHTVAIIGRTVFGTAPHPVLPCISNRTLYEAKGTLAAWREDFQVLLPGNPLLIYTVCFGISAAVASLCKLPRPNAMFCGESSTGKTTMAKVILSLYGPPREPHQWASTNNALEILASRHKDLPLVIDELGAGESASVLTAIYRLTGEVGKARATPFGGLGPVASLTSPIFATGEVSIWQQASASGQVPRAGHEVRLPCIPVAEPYGVYTRVSPQCEDGAAFGQRVKAAIERNYGTVYPALLQGLVEGESKWIATIAKYRAEVIARIRPPASQNVLSGVEERVLTHFATVALAGAIAVQLKILPITIPEVMDAVQQVYGKWQAMWSADQREPRLAALQNVKGWMKLKAEGHLLPLADWQGHGRSNVVGFVKMHKTEKLFLIHPEYFERDLCAHHSVQATVRVLRQHDMLVSNKNTNQLYVRMPRPESELNSEAVAGLKPKMGFYAIREKLLFDDRPSD